MKTSCRCIAVAAMTCAALPAAAQHGSPADDACAREAAGIVARLERLEAGLLQDPSRAGRASCRTGWRPP